MAVIRAKDESHVIPKSPKWWIKNASLLFSQINLDILSTDTSLLRSSLCQTKLYRNYLPI